MHVHLPKPLHGWREFAGEVGIIVIGVLILWGRSKWSRTFTIATSRKRRVETLTEEINSNLIAVKLRGTATPCIDRRLAEVRQLLDDWGRTGTFKRPLWVAQAPQLSVSFTRYDAALSAGRLALLPREEQYQIGEVIGRLRSFGDVEADEFSTWPKLRMLEAGADALTAGDGP